MQYSNILLSVSISYVKTRRESPIDVDDLLAEILLRLAPLPSSLPRASLVCARWRRIVTDPDFLRRFRAHHWKPLGVFLTSSQSGRRDLSFSFVSDPGDSIRHERFSVPPVRAGAGDDDYTWVFLGCRHGRVLLIDRNLHGYSYGHQMLVWNPVAAEHHLLYVPHFLDFGRHRSSVQGAVICASSHNHKVALVWNADNRAHACVYSSETGDWGDVVSTRVRRESGFIVIGFWNVMVGNSIYRLLFGIGSQLHMLEFDLGSQNLAVIQVPLPPDVYANHRGLYLTTLANGGGLSLIVMSANLEAQLWERTPDCDGAATARWMLRRTIELDKLLSLRPGFPECRRILGVEGDHNVMFVSTYRGVFMVHLESMQFEKIFETNPFSDGGTIHPFTTLYAPGTC
ncbi:unnamed protein product [Urochloa decumbens]|uniref:F-box domain-containing protein n=1 Tax=Urochloa decumbens TaxID=240449 RepID=A0ABC9AXZ4_9POAL